MSPERYFRWSIWSPLIVPVILWVPLFLARLLGARFEVGNVLGFLFLATAFGGLPYLIVAGVLARLLRRASLRRLRIASLYTPLVYAGFIFMIAVAVFLPERSPDQPAEPFSAAATYAGFAVGVGYAYVALVHLVYLAMRRAGVIEAPRNAV